MTATIKDIAKATGLGLATISKYLNGGNVRPENKIAIEKAIAELNYTVNSFARSLKTNRSKTVGILLPELNNAFYLNIVTGIETKLTKEKYAVMIFDCHDTREMEKDGIVFLLSKNVDGIIYFPMSYSTRHLKPALDSNVPILLIDSIIPKLAGKVDSVEIDNFSITREIVELLIKNGHRRIGFVTSKSGLYSSMDNRMAGYRAALEENGIEVDEAYIRECASNTIQGGHDGFIDLFRMQKDMTAVFTANHYLTMGTLIAVNEMGIKIPDDLSIIAFDYMPWHEILPIKLTTVEQPMKQIGQHAAEIMLRRLQDEGNDSMKEALTLSAKIRMGNSIKSIL